MDRVHIHMGRRTNSSIGIVLTPLIACCLLALASCTSISKTPTVKDAKSVIQKGASVNNQESYLIGVEDVLDISVWKEPDLNRGVTVRPDGNISFPLAGDVYVENKTVEQVREAVRLRLKKYIPKALVSVSLVRSSSYKIYVLGKVNNPGQYVLGSSVDVLQALSIANGLTPFAAEDEIKILRKTNGKEIIFPFAYSLAGNGKHTSQNIILKSGDIVLVP